MVDKPCEYIWSSYNDYVNSKRDFVDVEFGLSMISENTEHAIKEFKEFHENNEETDFSISNTKRLTDEQIKRRILKIMVALNLKKYLRNRNRKETHYWQC